MAIAALAGLCALGAFPLEGQSRAFRPAWAFRGSLLFFPEDNGVETDIGPILPSLGAAVILPLLGPLSVEASLDCYGTDYEYKMGRAAAAIPDNRAAFVIGSVAGIQLLGTIPLNSAMGLRVFAGPAADLRLCLLSYGLSNDPFEEELRRQTKAIAAYFWDVGRWFLPVAGAGFDYRFLSGVTLGLDFRVWFPLYKLWTGGELPPIEGWRFGGGIRVRL